MYFYIAYELRICSDLEIPELLPWPGGCEDETDIQIIAGAIDEEQQSLTQVGPFLFADENTILLSVPNIARYLVQSGNTIIYQKSDDSNDDDLRAFLLGSCIGAILIQRDFLVLHGCTIEIDGGCIVCVGVSTAGKSTLAATFMQNGFSIISDDVCAIDSNGMAVPGIPRIKINQDIAEQLNINTNSLQTIRAGCDNKYSLPLAKQFSVTRLPVLAIYELSQDQEDLTIKRDLNRFKSTTILNQNIYRPRYVNAMKKNAANFQRCCELTEHIGVSQIIRPVQKTTINQIRQLIIDDVERLKLTTNNQ